MPIAYNIPCDLKPYEEWIWDLRILMDSGEDLNQLGFKLQMPGFRVSEWQQDELVDIIVDFYRESKLKEGPIQTPETASVETP